MRMRKLHQKSESEERVEGDFFNLTRVRLDQFWPSGICCPGGCLYYRTLSYGRPEQLSLSKNFLDLSRSKAKTQMLLAFLDSLLNCWGNSSIQCRAIHAVRGKGGLFPLNILSLHHLAAP